MGQGLTNVHFGENNRFSAVEGYILIITGIHEETQEDDIFD